MFSIRSLRALSDLAEEMRFETIENLIRVANLSGHGRLINEVKALLESLFDDGDGESNKAFAHHNLGMYRFADVTSFEKKWREIADAWQGKVVVKINVCKEQGFTQIVLSLPEPTKSESLLLELMLWDGKKLHVTTAEQEYLSGEVLDASQEGDNLADVLVRLFEDGLN